MLIYLQPACEIENLHFCVKREIIFTLKCWVSRCSILGHAKNQSDCGGYRRNFETSFVIEEPIKGGLQATTGHTVRADFDAVKDRPLHELKERQRESTLFFYRRL